MPEREPVHRDCVDECPGCGEEKELTPRGYFPAHDRQRATETIGGLIATEVEVEECPGSGRRAPARKVVCTVCGFEELVYGDPDLALEYHDDMQEASDDPCIAYPQVRSVPA